MVMGDLTKGCWTWDKGVKVMLNVIVKILVMMTNHHVNSDNVINTMGKDDRPRDHLCVFLCKTRSL